MARYYGAASILQRDLPLFALPGFRAICACAVRVVAAARVCVVRECALSSRLTYRLDAGRSVGRTGWAWREPIIYFASARRSLYTADRYYYVFLLPLVTQCVLFLSAIRLPRWGTLAILAAALIGSRAHYLASVPRGNFEASGRALERGRMLVRAISSSASLGRPLILGDASIPLDGARNNAVTLAFLIYSEYPHGIPGGSTCAASSDRKFAIVPHRFQGGSLRRRPQIRIFLVGAAIPLDGRAGVAPFDRGSRRPDYFLLCSGGSAASGDPCRRSR